MIPTYGRRDSLVRLVTQLLKQDTRNFTYEVILVDDGSPEPVEQVLQGLLPTAMIPLRCIRKANGGPASARNFGAGCAAGSLLVFIDDDMSVRPDFLLAHVETQRAHGPALVNCYFDWEVSASPPAFLHWYSARIDAWNAARRRQLTQVSPDVFAIPSINATTANLSVPKELFQTAGGFDSGYPFGCEDQDFALRLEFAACPAFMTTKSVAVHIETHNSLKKVCARQARGSADTVRFLRRFAFEARFGKQPIAKVNDPIKMGIDPWRLVVKKLLRTIVMQWPIRSLVFLAVKIVERVFPRSRLTGRLYDFLVSAHTQKGWRDGLHRYGSEGPLTVVLELLKAREPALVKVEK